MAETPGRPADTSIHLRVNAGMLDWIDTHKGGRSRPAYIRSLIRAAAKVDKDHKDR
jgi:hypothetical protein